jgi:hypothetical protein
MVRYAVCVVALQSLVREQGHRDHPALLLPLLQDWVLDLMRDRHTSSPSSTLT